MIDIAVVIPILDSSEPWKQLVESLSGLTLITEIFIVSPETKPICETLPLKTVWLNSPKGRAQQMNHATKYTSAKFVWFLHADSKFKQLPNFDTYTFDEKTLYFFDLKFFDGPALMRINEFGLWVRSHIFKIPFGDQGFLLYLDLFKSLGGYDESASFGEDHLLTWSLKHKGYQIKGLNEGIQTSARKYTSRGWLKTTSRHLYLTVQQAVTYGLIKRVKEEREARPQ